jgi:hypothetical protein
MGFGDDDTGGAAFRPRFDSSPSSRQCRARPEALKCDIWRRATGSQRRIAAALPLAQRPFIDPFDARDPGTSALPWKPATEADVDVNNAQEPALAHRPPSADEAPAQPCAARWRQREGAADSLGHDEPPLAAVQAHANPTASEPRRALHDADLWQLARRAQGATLQLDFELRTAAMRQVFRRDFVYVSRQLHALQASRRVQGLDRASLDDALAAITRRADDVQALLQRIAAALQAAIASRGPASARLAFARPARFQATIVGPSAHRYLALLMQADETLAHLEMAWLMGLVEPARRSALASDCRRALQGFKDLACDQRQRVGEQVRELNARRRQCVPARAD